MSNGEEKKHEAEASDNDATLEKLRAFQSMVDTGRFICKTCGRAGKTDGKGAEMMFNTPCNPRKTSRAELLDKLCCAACAEEIAKRKNRRLGENGCGVYYLRLTLDALPSEEEIAIEIATDKKRPKWPSAEEVRKKLDLEYLHWVTESQKRRRLEQVRAYAEIFSELAFNETAEVELPIVRRGVSAPGLAEESETDLYCGLPDYAACCDREHSVRRYLSFLGEVIGICDEASRVFLEVRGEHEDDSRYDKLLWFRERARAEQSAAKWNQVAEATKKRGRRNKNR